MLRNISLLLAAFFVAGTTIAQVPTNQDCDGAIPVCQNVYFQANSFSGSGNYPNEINGGISCLFTGEFNSVWYTFTVQTSGDLCFTIIPNNSADDYDWAVYNLTNADCGDISTDASLEVSCNYDPIGGTAQTGPNGMAGLGFAPCISVLAGETYMVNLSNFTASADGYTLDFSASTAVILDTVPPQVDSVRTPIQCGATTLDVHFSENVLCSTVSAGDFTLTGPGGPYVISAVDGAVCSNGGTQENVYTLTISPALVSLGTYTVSLTNSAGLVEDLCGNTASPASFSFPLSFVSIDAGLGDTIALCSSDGPIVLLDSLNGTPNPGGTWLNPNGNPFGGSFTPGTDSTGLYTYTVGASPCPTASSVLLVDTLPPPDAGLSGNLIICNNDPTPLFTGLGGTPTSGGTWTGPGGIPSNGFFSAASDPVGIYTYQVPAIGSCPGGSAAVSISLNPFANPGIDDTVTVCETDGSFDLTSILGGSPDPGGSWQDPLGNPVSSTFVPGSSSAGNYTYTVPAVPPCPDPSAVVTVIVNPVPDPGTNNTVNVCTSDSAFDMVTLLGGTPDPGGQWSDFLGNPVSNIFTPGLTSSGPYIYTVAGTPPCGNASATLFVNVNQSPSISLISQQDLACNGDNNGSITVTASGGLLPYSFSIDGGTFGPDTSFTGLAAGPHTIEIQDGSGCINSLSVTLAAPPLLTGSVAAATNVSCFGGSDGSISVLAAGGLAPYQYSLDGITFVGSSTFSNLPLGIYQITIQDANGCQTVVNASITQPEVIGGVFSNPLPIACNGDSTGGFTIQASGGIAPYQFSLDGVNYSPANSFDSLQGGTYTVFIQDDNGCSTSIPYTVVEPTALTSVVLSQVDVDCSGNQNGLLQIAGSGGTPSYLYSLDGINFGTGITFSNLPSGFYTLYVQDANGCVASVDTTVSSPTGLIGGVDTLVDLTCNGINTGMVEGFAVGGVGPYQYSIDGVNFASSPVFTGLAAGSYTLSIQDANNCLVTANFFIQTPPPLSINILNQANVSCNGDTTGSITVNASGGIGTLEYSIDGVLFGASPSFSGLSAGSYTITVRDSNLCVQSVSTTLTEPSATLIQLANSQNIGCFGGSDGLVEVEGAGGVSPYSFAMVGSPYGSNQLFTNLTSGSYVFVIQDNNLCTDSLFVTLTQPDSLVGSIGTQTNVDCAGGNSGDVSINVLGGTAPFSYSLDGINFAASNLFTDLTAGTYTVSIQDANNCSDTVQVQINEPQPLSINLIQQNNVDCNGQSTGSLTFSPTGGTTPFVYSINNGNMQSDSMFQGLSAGTYFFTVIDNQGCDDTLSVSISEPLPLVAVVDSTLDVDCFGAATGFGSVFASGGSAPFQYAINSGQFGTDSAFSGIPAGSYQITVQDDSACTTTVAFDISEPPLLEVQLLTQRDVRCFGGNSGFIEIAGLGGTAPYQFSFENGPLGTLTSFDSLIAGTYSISVLDSQNCTANLNVTISQADSMEWMINTQTDVSCFGGTDGGVNVSANGGNAPYVFSLDNGPFQNQGAFSGLSAGIFQITVEDDSGCSQIFPVEVLQPDSLFGELVSLTEVDCHGNQTGSFQIQANGGTGPYQYSIDGLLFQQQGTFGQLGTGLYQVTIVDANGCETEVRDVMMNQPDPLTLLTIGEDVLCYGEETGTAAVEISGGIQPYTILWDDPLSQSTETITGLGAGAYVVHVSDANGCNTSAGQSISSPPELLMTLIGKEDAYCDLQNGSAVVEVEGGTGAYDIFWNASPAQEGMILQDVFAGTYLAIVQDDHGCFDSLSVEIGSIPTATASFQLNPPGDTLFLSRATVQFINESEDAVAYEWDFGDGVGKSDAVNPIYTFADTGTFDIRLTAYNNLFLCPDDTTIRLVVLQNGVLYVPSAFTPNGDGHNDVFLIKGIGVLSFEIAFFNRWGREVQRFSSIDQSWDGRTNQGKEAPEGVYMYAIKALLNTGDQIEQAGSVTLIR